MFRRKRKLEDFTAEIESHIQLETERLAEQGLSPEDARTAARRAFGNVTAARERFYEAGRWLWWDRLWLDIRYGSRVLRKSPGFTVVAIATLALGIGANTAIFSLVDAVLFRTLPLPHPSQLVVLGSTANDYPAADFSMGYGNCPLPSSKYTGCTFSYPLYEQLQAEVKIFSGLAAFVPARPYDTTFGAHAGSATIQFVSGNYFSTLDAQPILGRSFTPRDDSVGAPAVAVLSYGYWQSRFGGERSVIGKIIAVRATAPAWLAMLANKKGPIPEASVKRAMAAHPSAARVAVTIVGVAARRFTGLDPYTAPDFWLPLSSRLDIAPNSPLNAQTDPRAHWLEIAARLRAGVSLARAQGQASAAFARDVSTGSAAIYKPSDKPRLLLTGVAAGLSPLWGEYSSTLLFLLVLTGIVLLLACANVAGLTLARCAARRKEVAVRLALGTTRRRLIRQLLTESLLLAGAGGFLGILLAFWGADAIVAFLWRYHSLPRQFAVHPDFRVLGFTLAASAAVGVLAGLAPALRATQVELTAAMKDEASVRLGGARALPRVGLGSLLVIGQVALSVLVLASAGLLVRSLLNREAGHFGFDAKNLLLVNLHPASYAMTGLEVGTSGPDFSSAFRQLQGRFSTLPQVTSVSFSAWPPLTGAYVTGSYTVPGVSPPAGGGEADTTEAMGVGPAFFETLRVPIVSGRGLTPADYNSTTLPQPVVANQAFVRQAFGKEYPLGREVTKLMPPAPSTVRIVGVVQDMSYNSPPSGAPAKPALYFPLRNGAASFEIRTTANPQAIVPAVRQIVPEANLNMVFDSAASVSKEVDRMLYKERLIGWISVLFAALTLLLAAIGLYGLLAWEAMQRTREMGIRMALGAQRGDVLRMVLWRGAGLSFAGTISGLALAFAFTRLLRHFLFAVSATDPLSFSAVACLLLAVALAACYFPARRAMRVDPAAALRNE